MATFSWPIDGHHRQVSLYKLRNAVATHRQVFIALNMNSPHASNKVCVSYTRLCNAILLALRKQICVYFTKVHHTCTVEYTKNGGSRDMGNTRLMKLISNILSTLCDMQISGNTVSMHVRNML